MKPAIPLLVGLAAALCGGVRLSYAQPAAAPAEQQAPPADALSWVLGTNLGIAAVVHETGSAPEIVKDRFETCQAIADALGAELPPLPERTNQEKAAFGAEIVHYMIRGIEPLGKELTEKHTPQHAMLFEIGVKSSILAFMYAPGDSTGLTVAEVIEDRSKKCDLPAELWQPLVDSVRNKEPYNDVKTKMFAMHDAVRKHLMAGK